jgi:pimeloyl-ACP methyl ester carboxylesterase
MIKTMLLRLLFAIAALLFQGQAWAHADGWDDQRRWGPKPSRTVVLVHGAFADGSCWGDVISLLQAEGVKVISVQNPLSSLSDDVAATHRVLNQQTQPVVLVGHSWGGMVITQAGTHPKVDSLVYVAAFGPDTGMSVAGMLQPYPPAPWLGDTIADEAGNLTLSPTAFVKYFVPDLPRRQASALAAVQVPTFRGTLIDVATQVAWHTKPSWYLLAEQDQIINPDLQRVMSARMNARVKSIRSGHVPMLSHPHRVVAMILDAVHGRDR